MNSAVLFVALLFFSAACAAPQFGGSFSQAQAGAYSGGGYGGPGFGGPPFAGPGFGGPAYVRPGYGGPEYGGPGYGSPGYGGPGYGGSGYWGPRYGGGILSSLFPRRGLNLSVSKSISFGGGPGGSFAQSSASSFGK